MLKKIVPYFLDKGKHVLHYTNLQLHLRPGLKIKSTLCMIAEILQKSNFFLFYSHVI